MINGRVENDMKIFNKIEEQLINYPEFVVSWYYYLKANQQSATSCRDYINKIIRFLEFINNNVDSITTDCFNEDIIMGYVIKVQNKEDGTETSISYRQCVWSCLNNFFGFLYKRKMIPYNYFEMAGIERPKGNDLKKINSNRILLTKGDFKKILNAVDNGVGSNKAKGYQKRYRNRDKAIMLIFMTTGMRKTALEQINVRDIDFNNNTLDIIDKGHQLHQYHLTDEVINVINKWLLDRYFILGEDNDGALFISKEKQRMCGKSIARLVDKYASAALGYHISPHKLRSGFVSIIYEEKHDIEYARRAVGHSQITTTQRYIVTNNNESKEAADIISGIVA